MRLWSSGVVSNLSYPRHLDPFAGPSFLTFPAICQCQFTSVMPYQLNSISSPMDRSHSLQPPHTSHALMSSAYEQILRFFTFRDFFISTRLAPWEPGLADFVYQPH
jgi:hypothetical protein